MIKQVDNAHYWTDKYLCPERFLHYREQFTSIHRLNPVSVLEVGPGPGLLTAMLKQFCADVKSVDFADDVVADIHSDIKSMPLADSSYDLVCAFQVLEHLPWEDVKCAISELTRVCRRYVMFSVPNNDFMKKTIFSLQVEFFNKKRNFSITGRCYDGVSNPVEHYWEIGVGDATCESLVKIVSESNLVIDKQWMDGVDQYFLCRKIM